MKRFEMIMVLLVAAVALSSCAVISPQLSSQAEPVPFTALAKDVEPYKGKTVILGGRVLAVQSLPDATLLTVEDMPLSSANRPEAGKGSGGNFIVSIKGETPPHSDYTGREVTVAGRVLGWSNDDPQNCPSGCPKIESLEIYTWPGDQPLNYKFWPRYPYERGASSWERL